MFGILPGERGPLLQPTRGSFRRQTGRREPQGQPLTVKKTFSLLSEKRWPMEPGKPCPFGLGDSGEQL